MRDKIYLFLIALVLVVGMVSAADVAYLYKSNARVDDNVLKVFSDMNLSVDLIDEEDLPLDFSEYKLIFVGDEDFSKEIPIGEYPSIVFNHYLVDKVGLTDIDGVSRLVSREALKVKVNKNLYTVYTKAYDSYGVSIPYYFLDNENKVNSLLRYAGTYSTSSGENFGDVVSFLNTGSKFYNGNIAKSNLCFYGIIMSDFWTEDAKKFFQDCVNFVGKSCSSNSDCPSPVIGDGYCLNGSVYEDSIDFYCENPGTVHSRCSNNVVPNIVKECSYGCENASCSPECILNSDCDGDQLCSENKCVKVNCFVNSDCGTDGFINEKSCSENSIIQNYITYSCSIPGTLLSSCSSTTVSKTISNCSYNNVCSQGSCVEIDCSSDSDCGFSGFFGDSSCNINQVFQPYITYRCLNAGTLLSSCSSETKSEFVRNCTFCSDGDCSIRCKNNNDCNDNNQLTRDDCVNGNTLESSCEYKTLGDVKIKSITGESTNSSVKIIISAEAGNSSIDEYLFKINTNNWISTKNNNYIFSGLISNTSYSISAKAIDIFNRSSNIESISIRTIENFVNNSNTNNNSTNNSTNGNNNSTNGGNNNSTNNNSTNGGNNNSTNGNNNSTNNSTNGGGDNGGSSGGGSTGGGSGSGGGSSGGGSSGGGSSGSGSGGGGSNPGGQWCLTKWECTDWSECNDLKQIRVCSYPINFCKPYDPKPIEEQSCVGGEIESSSKVYGDGSGLNSSEEINQPRFPITGAAVLDIVRGENSWMWLAIIGLVVASSIYVYIRFFSK